MPQQAPIVIYTLRVTNRLLYVCDHLFQHCLGLNYLITENPDEACGYCLLIEYAVEPSGRFPYIPAAGLIFDEGRITDVMPDLGGQHPERYLFPGNVGEMAFLHFDIFSAIFFCLSMYQGYRPLPVDEHGRWIYSHWFLRQSGMDKYPYVDVWINLIEKKLIERGVKVQRKPMPSVRISFDVDHCWAFKNRTFLRHLRGMAGDVMRIRLSQLIKRLTVLSGLSDDPYEPFFAWLQKQSLKNARFYFLMREGKRDSLNPLNEEKRQIISRVAKDHEVGLHPSYNSKEVSGLLLKEKQWLESIIDKEVKASRQHYLRWRLPETFVELESIGIEEEHSIGYYDQPGFLAATSIPFLFYHLQKEKTMKLMLYPFSWMDSMNRYYRNIEEHSEWQELQEILEFVSVNKGTASLVFHNDSFMLERYRKILFALSDC